MPVIAIAMASTFTGCLDSNKDLYDSFFQMSNPMGEGFAAPNGFDWLMTSNTQVTVEVNDEYQDNYYTIELYDANPIISKTANKLGTGAVKAGEIFKTEVTLTKGLTTVYVKEITPTGLIVIKAAEAINGIASCSFKTSTRATRSLSTSTRGFTIVNTPDVNDPTIFPTECPTKDVFNESSFTTGKSYKVTSITKRINLGSTANIKLYVTEDIVLKEQLYLTQGSSLYILPGKKVSMPVAKNNGQSNCMISIGNNATLEIENDLQLDSNYKLYNLGTINAENLSCTNSSVFYNVGTTNIERNLSGQNSGSTIVNEGIIKAESASIQGNSHIINRDSGIVKIEEETVLNCTGGSWENEGKWTTDDMKISAWNDFCFNKCQLIVEDKLNMSEAHLIVDGGGYVICQELYMNNSRIDLGAKALFEVTDEAEFGYQLPDKGFKVTGAEKALIVIKKAVAKDPNNANIIHYSGNLQILCSDHPDAELGWGKRWTLTNGAEWAEEGSNTVSIPTTQCNAGFSSGTTTEPSDPQFPIVLEDNQNYAYLFEDQWPLYGDYDMNDLVLTINKRKLFIDNKNRVEKFELSIDLCAVGATKSIAAAIMFDAISASQIKEAVTYEDNSLHKGFNLNSQNIENRQDKVIVPLFDDAHLALGNNKYEAINTVSSSANNTKDNRNISFTMTFSNPTLSADAFNINKLNVFIIVGGNKGERREVHVIGFEPSKLAETYTFGGNNDNSSLTNGKYYISKENLAWGITVPANFKWPLEYTNIKLAYPQFEKWVTSGGQEETFWWNDFDVNKVFQTNKN